MVVDTSAWIEWLLGSPTGRALGKHLPDRSQWIVPTMVQLELAKWIRREGRGDVAAEVLALTQKCVVVPLWTDIAVSAADQGANLPTADAIIYATARSLGADLLTCDAHFDGLDGVVYVAKKAS